MVVVQTDAARARQAARGPLRFLPGAAGYRASFTCMGFTGSDIGALGNGLVDRLVVRGSAGTVTAGVREHLQAGADHAALTVLDTGHQPAIDSACQLASPRLGGTW